MYMGTAIVIQMDDGTIYFPIMVDSSRTSIVIDGNMYIVNATMYPPDQIDAPD